MKTIRLKWTTYTEASYGNGIMRLKYFNGEYHYYRVQKEVFEGFVSTDTPEDYWYDIIMKNISETCMCELNGCHR